MIPYLRDSQFTSRLRPLVTAALALAILTGSLTPTLAQTAPDGQTYGSGTYGEQDYGGTMAVETSQPTPTPTALPLASPTPSPTPAAAGDIPGTGADLGLWVALGCLLVATGLGFYGYQHRRHSRTT